ncbi:MAG: NAD-binding protein, partial [Hyphomicrobiaceae bacterium]|nr:NAD-binding protein [Hyphomicrobiaceae bacterium]
ETMTVLLVSGVFVVLTASVTAEQMLSLGWRDIAFVAVLLFAVRPLTIALSSLGTELTLKEKLLIGWIAPRGVVAVAVSGLFATALSTLGIEDGARLAPLAFLIVLSTVVLHGFSIGPLSRALGLTMKSPPGVLIVGGGRFARGLAERIQELELPVMIADRNWNRLRLAREARIPVYYGEILSEAAEHHVDFARFGHLVAATDNDAYNALVCTDFGPEIGRSNCYQIGRTDHQGPDRARISFTLGGRTLVDGAPSLDELEARLSSGWTFQKTRLTEEYTYQRFREERGDTPLVLFVAKPGGRLVFATAKGEIKADPGDTIVAIGPGRLGGEAPAPEDASIPAAPLP